MVLVAQISIDRKSEINDQQNNFDFPSSSWGVCVDDIGKAGLAWTRHAHTAGTPDTCASSSLTCGLADLAGSSSALGFLWPTTSLAPQKEPHSHSIPLLSAQLSALLEMPFPPWQGWGS